jgi:nucleotide-binding universal stress UspA family protein
VAKLFTRLLLATEHTPYDTGAESLAISMARRCGLPLAVVLPLVSNPEYEALAPQIAARAEQEAAAKIADIRAHAQAQGVDINLRVRRGDEPYRAIVDEARINHSELIILRRRGQRGFLAKLLIGEMVSKVVAHTPCHVLFAPREARMWNRRVLVAAKPDAQGERLIKLAAAIAAECELPLQIVCVAAGDAQRPQAEAFVTLSVEQAGACCASAQGEVRVGKAFTEILASTTTCQADLVVMGSRSDRQLGRATMGAVAQKVIGLSEIPVLAVHFESAG